jgi:TonB-dependent receptor
MKTLFKITLILTLALLVPFTMFAQIGAGNSKTDDEPGLIRGTILDAENGEPVFGVTVFVESTGSGASTDFDGKFDIELPAGLYDLRITYVSYRTINIEGVEVEAGEVNVLGNIMLEKSIEEMDEVVVTAGAINSSEIAMMSMKKRAANLMDGVSAQQFDRVGDSDAADALKRVTGVSIEGGKYVFVRGLGDRYTKTMLNSVDIPSLDPTKNSLQIDIFPTNLIDNMIITKSAVADMPADFTGGIVNIETKDFPEEPIFDVSASIGYNPDMHFSSDFLTYDGSSTDFLGFDNGKRDLPVGAGNGSIPTPISGDSPDQVNNFLRGFDSTLGPRTITNPMDYSLGLTLGNQFRLATNKRLGYILSATYKNSYSHYNDYQYGEYQTQPDPAAYDLIYASRQNGTVSDRNILAGGLAGVAYKTSRSRFKLTGMHLQNGETSATNFFIDNSESAPGQSGYTADSYNLVYGERSVTNFLLRGTHFFSESNWEIDWRVSPTFSSMVDPDIRKTAYTLSVSGQAPRFVAGAGGNPSRIWRNMDEVNYAGRLDLTKDYQIFENPSTLKFGGSYVYKERDYEILTFDMQNFGSWPEFTGDPSEVLTDENIYPNGTIYYQSGNPDPNPNKYNSTVDNLSAYVSNEFYPVTDLKVYLGLRAENYVQRHTGRDALFAQGDVTGNNLDNEKVLDALDFFPSANLTYNISDNQNLRLSYSRTIARPSFRELSFAQILDPVSDRIFNGGLFAIGEWDGNLTETRINNMDFRWERFSNQGQLLSISLFYKSFNDPIELVRIQAQATSSEFQPRNVGNGEVFGAEFEFRKALGFISSSLKNFSFNGNLTVVESRIDMTEQEFLARKSREKEGEKIDDYRQMAGQAPFLINAGLQYDNPALGLDAGFFYNLKGETLTVVGGGLFPDVYTSPFNNLRFNLNKTLGEEGQTSLNLSISNILNDRQEELYQGFRAQDQIFSSFTPGRAVSLGIKYSF